MWPPLVASVVMAGVLLPLEFGVFHAGDADREVVAALALLALETVIAAVIYLGVLRLLMPEALREALRLLKTARRRRGGVSPSGENAVPGAAGPASPESSGPAPADEDRGGS
jgi:hypothetical protein